MNKVACFGKTLSALAALLAPASTNHAISGDTGTFTVSPPASLPSTLFYRISAKQE